VHIVVTDHEEEIVDNVRRKEVEGEKLSSEIIASAKEYEMEELGKMRHQEVYDSKEFSGEGWNLYQGDCVDEMKRLDDDSIDLSVFSPPFLALYTYSATERDLGNCRNQESFFDHFRFVIDDLMRVTKPGRLCCVHVAQVPTTLVNHGVIGIKDFRGQTISEFIDRDWIYHGEVVIDKDPQAQAIRTHSKGLLFVQLKKDASWLRPAMADYILVFRKPGENAVPIHPDISNDQWIEWARPIWYGIRESDTLNAAKARSDEDDRHVCPLQLGTIERVVRLWSNRGDTVLSPFAGIGSEGYVSIQQGRKFVGIELKPLYARTAIRNLRTARAQLDSQLSLFRQ
jgi:DNA modification methylase